jgi:hypothetical protein
MIARAWADRNCRQVGPDLRGAGSIPAALGRGSDLVAETGQLALDPPVPPSEISPGHLKDQLLDRRCC